MQRRKFLQISTMALAAAISGCASDSVIPVAVDGTTTLPTLARLDRDSSFAFDSAGNLLQIDQVNAILSKFDGAGGVLWTRNFKGRGVNQLDTPVAVAFDQNQRIWVVDRSLSRLVVLDANGAPQSTVDPANPLLRPQDILISGSRVFVCDGSQHRIVVFDLSGQVVGNLGGFGSASGLLNYPRGLALDPQGRIHVVDVGNNRVQIFNRDGALQRVYGQQLFLHGRGLDIRSDGLICVADSVAGVLLFFAADLSFLGTLRPLLQGQAYTPLDVQFGPQGNLFLHAEPGGPF